MRPAGSCNLLPESTLPILPARQPPSCASVGDTIPNFVKPHYRTRLRQQRQPAPPAWLRPPCHGTALHSRSLALARPCTSADSTQMPGPLSLSPTQSFRFPCEAQICPLQIPYLSTHAQCHCKPIPPAAEGPCRTTDKNPSTHCQTFPSIRPARPSQPGNHPHIRQTRWRCPARPQSPRMDTSEEEANSSVATSGPEVLR